MLTFAARPLEENVIFFGIAAHATPEGAPLHLADACVWKILPESSFYWAWQVLRGNVVDRPTGISLNAARDEQTDKGYDGEVAHVSIAALLGSDLVSQLVS